MKLHLAFAAVAVLSAAASAEVTTTCSVPTAYLDGDPFVAHVVLENKGTAPERVSSSTFDGGEFRVDGRRLGKQEPDQAVQLLPGTKLTLEIDLGDLLDASPEAKKKGFELAFGKQSWKIDRLVPAPAGLDFMALPLEELSGYQVLLQTNRGEMRVEFYPDLAPNHVRNFLDLAYTKFYDGTLFHRVGPTFMIQGGDPNTRSNNPGTSGGGPRRLKLEASERKHERGILSMARSDDPDSASSQFFIMNGVAPPLDRKYSVFGKLVEGYEALDAIANAPGTPLDPSTFRPREPQRLVSARVVRIPEE